MNGVLYQLAYIYKLGPMVRVAYLISDTTWMRML